MKFSNFSLGLAVIAGFTAISGVAEAATLSFADGSINLNSEEFEFEFLGNKGWYKSSLFVADTSLSNVQTLFSETQFYDDSPITPPSGLATSGGWAVGTGSYVLGWNSVDIDNSLQPTVYSDQTSPFQFNLLGSSNSWYTFGIEDKRSITSDYDYNDGTFRVRAVPVPAIVPGIALAAAFFGRKALKRTKKNASESIV